MTHKLHVHVDDRDGRPRFLALHQWTEMYWDHDTLMILFGDYVVMLGVTEGERIIDMLELEHDWIPHLEKNGKWHVDERTTHRVYK